MDQLLDSINQLVKAQVSLGHLNRHKLKEDLDKLGDHFLVNNNSNLKLPTSDNKGEVFLALPLSHPLD